MGVCSQSSCVWGKPTRRHIDAMGGGESTPALNMKKSERSKLINCGVRSARLIQAWDYDSSIWGSGTWIYRSYPPLIWMGLNVDQRVCLRWAISRPVSVYVENEKSLHLGSKAGCWTSFKFNGDSNL